MARGKLTIYDVPAHIRSKGAAAAKKNYQQLLSNPQLTAEQVQDLQARIRWASKWESLNVSEVLPPRTPVNHVVSVVENLSVTEDS